MQHTIEFAGIGLCIIALGIAGALTARRARLARRAGIIKSEPWAERRKAVAAAIREFGLETSRSDYEDETVVLEQTELRRERDLVLAQISLGLAALIASVVLLALIADTVNIESGLGRIAYDLVLALVVGGFTGIVAGIVTDSLIERRRERRWRDTRKSHHIAIAASLDRLLNKAVPVQLQARDKKERPYEGYIDVTVNFIPADKSIFDGLAMEWRGLVKRLLDNVSPAKPLSSEPLLLIEPLNQCLKDLETLFQTFGPILDPTLAKKTGGLLTYALRFRNFAGWDFNWRDPNYGDRYFNQLLIILRLAYELMRYIHTETPITRKPVGVEIETQ